MTDRILDLSESPARLRVDTERLVIKRDGKDDVLIPLADLAVVIVSHPRVTFSQAVLSGLATAGGAFVTCDKSSLPVAMLLPLQAHHLQAERFARQAAASLPAKKRLWQQIVRAKIAAQARCLRALHGDEDSLQGLVPRVRSGDPQNVEARAARRYWPALFNYGSGETFRRRRDGDPPNGHLNYGYAVLRAIVARAICAAGLHPSLGLHHHNRYNAFCLADDLMEPFRPLVDASVARHAQEHGMNAPLDKNAKNAIIMDLLDRYPANGEARTLFDWLSRAAQSLTGVFSETCKRLTIAELSPLENLGGRNT